jgi:hypothetical protein
LGERFRRDSSVPAGLSTQKNALGVTYPRYVPDLTKLTATDWQAIASIASALAAAAAVTVAFFAWRTANKALTQTASSERARLWEARVQGVVPIAVDRPGRYETIQHGHYAGDGEQEMTLHVGASPAVDLRIIAELRDDPTAKASILNVGTLAANTEKPVGLLVDVLYAAAPSPPNDVPVRVQLQWFGQLGQWVVQEFTWNIGNHYDELGQQWRMVRWHVDPKVDGMKPLDIQIT